MCNIVSPIIIAKMVSIQTKTQSGKKFNEPTESNELTGRFLFEPFHSVSMFFEMTISHRIQ